MAVAKEVSRFTRDALVAGHSRDAVAQALTASGPITVAPGDAWAITGAGCCSSAKGL